MNSQKQFLLDFKKNESFAESDFIVGESNHEAFSFVTSPISEWKNNISVIKGSKVCGKTHLAYIWASRNQAIFLEKSKIQKILAQPLDNKNLVFEDIDNLDENGEEQLFHLINKIVNEDGKLLLTSSCLGNQNIFPDLRSRLLAAYTTEVREISDDIIKTVIIKLFSDMQVTASLDVVEYIAKRTERNYKKIIELISNISKDSFEKKRNITIPFVKESLKWI